MDMIQNRNKSCIYLFVYLTATVNDIRRKFRVASGTSVRALIHETQQNDRDEEERAGQKDY